MLYNKMLPDSLKVPVVVRVCNEDPEILRQHQGNLLMGYWQLFSFDSIWGKSSLDGLGQQFQ